MRELGGYFEWEMASSHSHPHAGATSALKSARSCLALLLQRERPRKVRVPYFICGAALEPFERESTEVDFYALDDAFNVAGGLQDLAEDERLLYVNYFALKSDYVKQLEEHYRDRLWVDQVQAFFFVPEDSPAFHFNSARKFFGVPDGAYLYLPGSAVGRFGELSFAPNTSYCLEHLTLRLEGRTLDGLSVFRRNERLCGGEIKAVSDMGKAMLGRIDYASAARRRRRNYQSLHAALKESNRMPDRLTELGPDSVPFSYPYLPRVPLEREYFWDRQIYLPILWQECATRATHGYGWEKTLAGELLSLPVDQRYDSGDMDRLLASIRGHPSQPV